MKHVLQLHGEAEPGTLRGSRRSQQHAARSGEAQMEGLCWITRRRSFLECN